MRSDVKDGTSDQDGRAMTLKRLEWGEEEIHKIKPKRHITS